MINMGSQEGFLIMLYAFLPVIFCILILAGVCIFLFMVRKSNRIKKEQNELLRELIKVLDKKQ
ncbi:MAG TPA: hypothetical protein VIH57_26255 [Bacteroidales bacterium]